MDKTVRFRAQMSCEGCSNAITRIFNRIEGVKAVECDLEAQLVTV